MATEIPEKCFACDRPLGSKTYRTVITCDGQRVHVGSDCYRRVASKGKLGYQPPLGGPSLFSLEVV